MDMVPRQREPHESERLVSADRLIDPDVLARLAADPEPPQLHVRPIPDGRAWVLDVCCARLYLSDRLRTSQLSGVVSEALDALAVEDLRTEALSWT